MNMKCEACNGTGTVPTEFWIVRRVRELEDALREIAHYEEPWPQDPSDVYDHFQTVASTALAVSPERTSGLDDYYVALADVSGTETEES